MLSPPYSPPTLHPSVSPLPPSSLPRLFIPPPSPAELSINMPGLAPPPSSSSTLSPLSKLSFLRLKRPVMIAFSHPIVKLTTAKEKKNGQRTLPALAMRHNGGSRREEGGGARDGSQQCGASHYDVLTHCLASYCDAHHTQSCMRGFRGRRKLQPDGTNQMQIALLAQTEREKRVDVNDGFENAVWQIPIKGQGGERQCGELSVHERRREHVSTLTFIISFFYL